MTKMRILNFGSLNLDYVYQMPHFVAAGETLASNSFHIHAGGKGLNQSIALARAGADVWHAGKVGPEAGLLIDTLKNAAVNTSLITKSSDPTGHAIIQVTPSGENSIILYGGANQRIQSSEIEEALKITRPGDFLLLQNEINSVASIIEQATQKNLRIVFNPAPFDSSIFELPLKNIHTIVLNEIEGAALGETKAPESIIKAIHQRFNIPNIVLTLGAEGVLHSSAEGLIRLAAHKVKAVDTTAAGDTFIGYFLADLAAGRNTTQALESAVAASALCVTRAGAAPSIPGRREVEEWLRGR